MVEMLNFKVHEANIRHHLHLAIVSLHVKELLP